MERFFAKVSGKNKISAVIALGRPWNGLFSMFLMFTGLLMETKNLPNFFILACAGLALLILYMGGAVINDIYDFQVDRINMPYRPLQSNLVSVKLATEYAVLLYAVSIILSLLISVQYFVVMLLMFVISLLYSMPPFSLKNRHLIGNVSLSISTVMLSLISGFVLARENFLFDLKFIYVVLLFTTSLFLINLSKDFKDIYGDKKFGKITAVLKYGANKILPLVLIGEILLFVTNVVFYYFFVTNVLFLTISIILTALLFSSFYILYRDRGTRKEIAEKVWSYERTIVTCIIINILIFLYISP